MAAVWFVVTIPTPSYEKDLANATGRSAKECTEIPTVDGTDTSTSADETAVQIDVSTIPASGIESKGSNRLAECESTSIETDLKRKLDELNVYDAVWNQTQNDHYYQITFPAISSDCETILSGLAAAGIGSRPGTTLSVLPCTIHYNGQGDVSDDENDPEPESIADKTAERCQAYKSNSSFIQSIKSRLTVAQVVEGVRGSALLTFDFIMFILLAGMLAAMGLVENSSVVLVASMLVSPMMGPILAGTFGAVIRDRELMRLGVKNELIGLLLCLSFGFVFGIVYGSVNNWNPGFWITDEMKSRGQLRSLWSGVLIALPSGAGVALSVLGGNAGSLVGVAISASLLPPVVNGGLLWAAALTKYIQASIDGTADLKPPDTYEPSYSTNMAIEACALGGVSIFLTILNILCIFIMGVAVLKIKEVAPQSTITKRFWHCDIKEVRNHNATLSRTDASELGDEVLAELAAANMEEEGGVVLRNSGSIRRMSRFQKIIRAVESDPVYRTVRTRSAFLNIEPRSHPTWHLASLPEDGTMPDEWKLEANRLRRYHRSLSNPQGQDGEVSFKPDRPKQTEMIQRLSSSPRASANPTSPSRRLHFNFNSAQLHRFTVTQADEIPLRPPRRSLKRKSQEFDPNFGPDF